MYRLSITKVKIIIFIVITIFGAIATFITPKYFGQPRIVDLVALLTGQLGMCFIPILAIYPKATPIQVVLLALISLITSFILCFAAWIMANIIGAESLAFMHKEGEFHINTYALFVANVASTIAIITNFRLVYDEELTKQSFDPGKEGLLSNLFQRSFLQPPAQKFHTPPERKQYKTKTKTDDAIGKDFLKPFEIKQEEISYKASPQEPVITATPVSISEPVKEKYYKEKRGAEDIPAILSDELPQSRPAITKEKYKKRPAVEDAPQVSPQESTTSSKYEKEKYKKKTSLEDTLEEESIKLFEFEPEAEVKPEDLPPESSGKLFASKTDEKPPTSEFLSDEEIGNETK